MNHATRMSQEDAPFIGALPRRLLLGVRRASMHKGYMY